MAGFLARRLFVITAAQTPDGRVWASLRFGPPGFMQAMDGKHLHIVASTADGSPPSATITRTRIRLQPR